MRELKWRLRFIIGKEFGQPEYCDNAVLWCSTTGCAFGLTFSRTENGILSALQCGQAFIQYAQDSGIPDGDVRAISTAECINLQEQFFQLSDGAKQALYGIFRNQKG